MWFLKDPKTQKVLFDHFLQVIQNYEHRYFSTDALGYPNTALALSKKQARDFYDRFIICSYVRIGARHDQAMAPFVGIEFQCDQSAIIQYLVAPHDLTMDSAQFAWYLDIVRRMFFTENNSFERLYLPFKGGLTVDFPILYNDLEQPYLVGPV